MTHATDRTRIPPPFRVHPWGRVRFALARALAVAATCSIAACSTADPRGARPAATAPVAGIERGFVGAAPVAVLASESCGERAVAPAEVVRRDWYAGPAVSYGPDLGASVEVGRIIDRNACATWSVEARATWLFADNTEFLDRSSTEEPADWKQLSAGVKVSFAPEASRHLTGRLGIVLADVHGNLNLVRDAGTYYGAYAGIGFETDLTERLTMGPSVTACVLTRADGDDTYFVPQLDWHLTWSFGAASCVASRRDACAARRELYVGASATALPGLGGSLEFGQVFARDAVATWSFEVQATKQTLDGVFGGTDPGADYAQLRAGAKASLLPECRGHVVGRLGFCTFKPRGTTDFIDLATTYYGLYVGVGYEWELSERWSTGPEASLLVGFVEGGDTDVRAVPQVGWHLIRWL